MNTLEMLLKFEKEHVKGRGNRIMEREFEQLLQSYLKQHTKLNEVKKC